MQELRVNAPEASSPSSLEIQQSNLLQVVMQAAADPSVDADKLGKLLEIGERLELQKKKQQWAESFHAAKREIDGITITKHGKITYESKNNKPGTVVTFLRYDEIADAVKPILARHSLVSSYRYRHESTPPKTICVMTLTHANGYSQEFESVPLPMIDDSGGKTSIHGAGSVMTYGRRYVTCGAFDIVAREEDDDGSMGKGVQPIADEDLERITNCVRACDDKQPGFGKLFTKWMVAEYKVSAPTELNAEQAKGVMAKIREKMAGLGIK
jgi:hypothetical protein